MRYHTEFLRAAFTARMSVQAYPLAAHIAAQLMKCGKAQLVTFERNAKQRLCRWPGKGDFNINAGSGAAW